MTPQYGNPCTSVYIFLLETKWSSCRYMCIYVCSQEHLTHVYVHPMVVFQLHVGKIHKYWQRPTQLPPTYIVIYYPEILSSAVGGN